MPDVVDDQSEYERGFADGYIAGRRSKRGLGLVLGLALAVFVAGAVILNLWPTMHQDGMVGSAEPVQLPLER